MLFLPGSKFNLWRYDGGWVKVQQWPSPWLSPSAKELVAHSQLLDVEDDASELEGASTVQLGAAPLGASVKGQTCQIHMVFDGLCISIEILGRSQENLSTGRCSVGT